MEEPPSCNKGTGASVWRDEGVRIPGRMPGECVPIEGAGGAKAAARRLRAASARSFSASCGEARPRGAPVEKVTVFGVPTKLSYIGRRRHGRAGHDFGEGGWWSQCSELEARVGIWICSCRADCACGSEKRLPCAALLPCRWLPSLRGVVPASTLTLRDAGSGEEFKRRASIGAVCDAALARDAGSGEEFKRRTSIGAVCDAALARDVGSGEEFKRRPSIGAVCDAALAQRGSGERPRWDAPGMKSSSTSWKGSATMVVKKLAAWSSHDPEVSRAEAGGGGSGLCSRKAPVFSTVSMRSGITIMCCLWCLFVSGVGRKSNPWMGSCKGATPCWGRGSF